MLTALAITAAALWLGGAAALVFWFAGVKRRSQPDINRVLSQANGWIALVIVSLAWPYLLARIVLGIEEDE